MDKTAEIKKKKKHYKKKLQNEKVYYVNLPSFPNEIKG